MALYIEQRIDQLEAHAVEDGKLLESVAKGLATLTVQVQKNHEQAQRNHEEAQRNHEEAQRNHLVTNNRIDDLRTDMNSRFEVVQQDISDIKTTQSLILKLLETKLK